MNNEEFKTHIVNIFDKYKRKNVNNVIYYIPILNENAEIIGILKPITYDYSTIFPNCIELMSKWRRENPSLSNSIFEVTDARTRKWIDDLILRREDRLLFLIDDLENNHLGHIAYSSFDFLNQTAEIDAVLHGEHDGVHNIMTYTIKAMIQWGFNELSLSDIYLVTNDDNERAINLYQKCDFKIIGEIPLYRRELENEIRWDADDTRDVSEAERFEVRMKYVGER